MQRQVPSGRSFLRPSSTLADNLDALSVTCNLEKRLLYNCTCCIIRIVEIVIDTSALLAVSGEQPERAALIRLTRGATLVAPASVHWEVGNALSAMFKRKAIGVK